jgi:protein-L-isoaspartate(D-aspartate) O-methyltransferase
MMTTALALQPRMRVLEIGTGSGYQTAVLSHLCRMVYTLERFGNLQQQAKTRFSELKLRNITARTGDGYKGWPEAAPFDRIMVTAAAPEIPEILLDQLSDKNGIMVIPMGPEGGEQWLMRYIKTSQGITEEALMRTRFVPMVQGKAEA